MVNNDKETNEELKPDSDIQSIHNNLEKDMKSENEKTLGDFYERKCRKT